MPSDRQHRHFDGVLQECEKGNVVDRIWVEVPLERTRDPRWRDRVQLAVRLQRRADHPVEREHEGYADDDKHEVMRHSAQ